jgi:regulator of protease activity HflC (stomatin/prohibitin superfamily)
MDEVIKKDIWEKPKPYILLGIGFILLMLFWHSLTIVGAGERGVVKRMGRVTGRILDPGMNFTIPIIENTWMANVRIQKEQKEANAASQDLQTVNSTIALNFHLDPAHVTDIYINLGAGYMDRIIDPAIQEVFKASTAQYPVADLLTKRNEVKEKVRILLEERLHKNNIIVDDVSIVNFSFSPEYDKAIEAKQVAQQQAEQAQYKLDAARKEAEAMKIKSTALENNPNLIQYEAVLRWNGVLPQVTGGSIPMVNIK